MSETVMRLIAELVPHSRNYNKHSDRQVDDLADSLRRFGQRKPVVTWGDVIVAGHGLTLAAQMLGWSSILTQPVPWDWDETTVLAYLAADNELARQADPDLAQLAAIAKELGEVDGELARLAAGGEDALRQLLETLEEEKPPGDAETQVDKAEELQAKWGVEIGQMWQLGEHRIICGDCTDRAVVERVMGGEKAELLFTSPPYADMREYSGNDLSLEMLTPIFLIWKKHVNYFSVNLGIQYKNDEVYEYWNEWVKAARDAGLKLLSWNIWDRLNATSVSSQLKMFAIQHEWVFVFGEKSKDLNRTWEKSEESKSRERYYSVNVKGQKVTTRRQQDGSVKESVIGEIYSNKNMGTVFTGYAEMARNLDHPARFPLEFPAGYIGAMTSVGEIVAEPFSGSGTTLIAAQNLNRKCRAVEISPAYVAVAIQRWVDVTGGTPVLL